MRRLTLVFLLLLAATSAIASSPARLRVVATTSIVGDIVQAIGGDDLDLTVLVGAGMDPHTFEPSPRDAAAVATAQLLFVNGGGLETFLEPLLHANRQAHITTVDLCEGLPLLHATGPCTGDHHDHDHGDVDPHVWFDPTLVARWADTIARTLAERDPERGAAYRQRAAAYQQQLAELDRWIQEQIAPIPREQRRFVTDHHEFAYFAARYDFTITGALLPNLSTAAESSAREMALLEKQMRATATRLLILGHGVNPSLAERVAHDTGARLVTLFTASLSDERGPAPTYLAFMRHNIATLLAALREETP